MSFVSSADSVVGTLDLTSYRKRGEREGGVSTKVCEEVLTLTLTLTQKKVAGFVFLMFW